MHENEKKLSLLSSTPAFSFDCYCSTSARCFIPFSNSPDRRNHFAYYNILKLLSRHDIVVKYELLTIGSMKVETRERLERVKWNSNGFGVLAFHAFLLKPSKWIEHTKNCFKKANNLSHRVIDKFVVEGKKKLTLCDFSSSAASLSRAM